MCDLHPNCATVSMLASADLAASPAPTACVGDALPAGLLSLTQQEYTGVVLQQPLHDYYQLSETPLSEGRWASVYKCWSRATGAEYAAKLCQKRRLGLCAQQEIVHEVAALRQCRRCPRIVQLQQVFETEHLYILVMEFGRGGDLQAILDDNQVPYEADVVRFMRCLLEGLVFIHERNLAHLDIKPQNVVLTAEFPDCDVKLCDLEISRVISSDHEIREMLGTPDYVAPEILRFDPVTLTADIWSVGVLAYVLLTGFTPFGGDTDAETFRNISRAELDFPHELFEDVSELAKDFIRRCVVKDPRARLSARQSLMHPWLQQLDTPVVRPPSVHGSSQSIISMAGEMFGSTDSVRTLRRSVSKSRELLCEKVNHSQLKKNISKSRERLCDLKFGLSKSRERMQNIYRGVSKSSEVLSSKPPWRAAGVNCPLGKPLPPPMERMGSFKVRDQYQSQVVAGLGSNQSISSIGSPFIRHCSLRKRKQQQEQQEMPPADFRSSLRRHKNNSQNQRRNSLQMDNSDEGVREMRRRSHSNREELEPLPARQERRRDSRREPAAPPPASDGKNMIIVEIISDGEEEDVFTRLYKDRLRDSELKWRKLRDTDLDRDDDEKENKSGVRPDQSLRRCTEVRSRSRDLPNSRNQSKSGSDEALTDRLNTLPSSTDVKSTDESGAPTTNSSSKQPSHTSHVQSSSCHKEVAADQPPPTPAPVISQGSGRQENVRNESVAIDCKSASKIGRRSSLTNDKETDNNAVPQRLSLFPEGGEDLTESTNSTSPERPQRTSSSGSVLASCGGSVDMPELAAVWRGSVASLPARFRRNASFSPEPAAGARPPRRGSLVATAEQAESPPTCQPQSQSQPRQLAAPDTSPASSDTGHPAAPPSGADQSGDEGLASWIERRKAFPVSASHCGVGTEPAGARCGGKIMDRLLLAAVVDEQALWEDTEPLSGSTLSEYARLETPSFSIAPVAPEQTAEHRRPQERTSPPPEKPASPRQDSAPPPAPAAPLSKSSTDEDVHRRARTAGDAERRAVAFAESAAAAGRGGYRRSSSLSSDLGSSELSSETGSDSCCIVSWEAEAGRDRSTQLKPVVRTRAAGRPRSHSSQAALPAAAEPSLVRQRGRSNSVTGEQVWSAAQPWGALCSGSVARAFQKFHWMSAEQRHKRRQSSPNIAAIAAKVSDMGDV